MGRKLYVYTKKESITNFAANVLLGTWYDVTKEIAEGTGDIHTTQIEALRGAQDVFEEVYIDNEIIWPNEKQNITNKEIRFGHDLSKLVACWYRYVKEGEPV